MNPIRNLADVLGWKSLIVCDGPNCHFSSLVQLAVNIIDDLIIISTVLATISFIFAGFKLITSQGNPGALKDAKDTLLKVLIGYIVILAAWLLVYTIGNVLLNGGDYSLLGAPTP